VFGLAVVVLILGVVYAMRQITTSKSSPRVAMHGEVSDTFTVTNPELIRPGPEAYRRFRSEDSTWRAMYARPVSLREMLSSAAGTWRPSPYQQMRDDVFKLGQEGQAAEAARLLEAWLAQNPEDREEMIDLARLYALMGSTRNDDAVRWYRRALSLRNEPAIRAELAALLLNTKAYTLAAQEYRTLIAAEPAEVNHRLGLARSLAWGEKPRAAERELLQIVKDFPADTAARSLLVAVRDAFEPSAEEALEWVEERPDFLQYRLALARAYVREKKFPRAYAQYDTIIEMNPTGTMLAEAAAAHSTGRDSVGNAALLGRAVALAPADTALRHQFARALTWAGDRTAAIEQYGVLIEQAPVSEFYFGRGQLYVWSNEFPKAVADLEKAAELKPNYETYALLGDVYRWSGNYKKARTTYTQALALKPNDAIVLAALADVKRLENMVYAAAPGVDEVGWISNNSYAEDNSGFLFLSAGISRGFRLSRQWLGSIAFDQRRISQRSPNGTERYVSGYLAGASTSYYVGRWALSANGGIAQHALVNSTPYGGASVQLTTRAVTTVVGISSGPIYNSLMTTQALLRFSDNGTSASTKPLTGTTARAGVRVPVGPTEISLDGEQLWLSDGNRRTGFAAAVRVPVTKRLSAMYIGSQLGYSERSDIYWDPTRYTSHSLGLEYAMRKPTGLSIAVRALPGVARSSESFAIAQDTSVSFEPRNVMQMSASGDIEYRRRRWALIMSGGYGRGREGGYQSLNGSLRLRLDW
jgi:tetratricopeptide (TPR) repeat protein